MLYPILLLASAFAGDPTRVAIGGPARTFALPAVNADLAMRTTGSATVRLHDLVGPGATRPQKAVILHFFEQGAGDHVTGQLSKLDAERSDLVVVGILSDPRGLSSVSNWVAAKGIGFPVLFDEHGVVFERYGVDKAPLTMLVDADGRVQAIGNPQASDFNSELDAALTNLR